MTVTYEKPPGLYFFTTPVAVGSLSTGCPSLVDFLAKLIGSFYVISVCCGRPPSIISGSSFFISHTHTPLDAWRVRRYIGVVLFCMDCGRQAIQLIGSFYSLDRFC